MQFYKDYGQTDVDEIQRLVNSQSTCLLLTQGDGIECGIFNHVLVDEKFYLHLNRLDPQVNSMRKNGRAKLIFEDILAVIPSYWVDARYAGAATTYYRYAEFECSVRLIEDAKDYLSTLEIMLKRFQPEGRYDALSANSTLYKSSFAAILICELIPTETITKWKLGQNRDGETRQRVAAKLRERAQNSDLRAAEELERWHARPIS